MARPPEHPVDVTLKIVLSVLSGEATQAEAARRHGISKTWTQRLLLSGELARCEPKSLRYRLLHTAGRLVFHARTATLRLLSQPSPLHRVAVSAIDAAGNLEREAQVRMVRVQ